TKTTAATTPPISNTFRMILLPSRRGLFPASTFFAVSASRPCLPSGAFRDVRAASPGVICGFSVSRRRRGRHGGVDRSTPCRLRPDRDRSLHADQDHEE